jgi:hypothetical protein
MVIIDQPSYKIVGILMFIVRTNLQTGEGIRLSILIMCSSDILRVCND